MGRRLRPIRCAVGRHLGGTTAEEFWRTVRADDDLAALDPQPPAVHYAVDLVTDSSGGGDVSAWATA